jgi:hypothetical protein
MKKLLDEHCKYIGNNMYYYSDSYKLKYINVNKVELYYMDNIIETFKTPYHLNIFLDITSQDE